MPNNATYTTGRKDEFRRMNQDGDVENWWRIYATTTRGTRFNIEVRDKDLAQAPAMLAAKAKEVDSI